MLYVSKQADGEPEIFHSVQGEGISAGTPAVFLRLAFCNLRCSWCDTKYTWDWEHHNKEREVIGMSVQEIVERLSVPGCRRLVVTGGEPLIQQKALIELLAALKGKGFYIEIETNGTIVPDGDLICLIDQWNVSPKLENSGNPLHLREIAEVYSFFTNLSSSYFKYVIQAEYDLSEVHDLIDKYNISRERVILMPEVTDDETLIERGRWLAEVCKEEGYRFSTRLQVLLWRTKEVPSLN